MTSVELSDVLLTNVDVKLRTRDESSVESPNPDYLNIKIHIAFAKVLHICVGESERMLKTEGTLRMNKKTGFRVIPSALEFWSPIASFRAQRPALIALICGRTPQSYLCCNQSRFVAEA